MYSYAEIRHLHLEPTTRCNAACPMCARTVMGRAGPGLPLADLSLGDIRAIANPMFLQRLTAIDLCGGYGDPAIASDLHGIIGYLRTWFSGTLTLYTNGGIRQPDWWRELARALGPSSLVVFAIDGLSDTNGIHRRQVNFDSVIANATAFIEAGGSARWEYLVFRHNVHQVQDARQLSEELGFREFSVKRSNRFLEQFYEHVPEVQGREGDYRKFPIYDRRGRVANHLEPPDESWLVNATVREFPALLEKWGSLDALFDATPVRCRVLDTASVFVSASGHAYPCCWVYVQATRPGVQGYPKGADLQVHHLILDSGGYEGLDAKANGLQSVVEGRLFDSVSRSWGCASTKQGKLKVCARACGTDFPGYDDQFVDISLLPRGLRGATVQSQEVRP